MLKVQQLGCERQRRQLFSDLSFAVPAGEMLYVRGANGAGKSTLLRILAGLYLDHEGEVSWDLATYPLFIGHKPGVKAQLTCRENLAWLLAVHGHDAIDPDELLTAVGLRGYQDVPCGNLSEGQRKKVNLARLFLADTPAWILDEPFAAIDQEGVKRLEARLGEHLAAGATIILTSHQPPADLAYRTLDL